MIGKNVKKSEAIPAAKVKEILEEYKEKQEEKYGEEKLRYEQKSTLEHVYMLNKLSLEDAEKLIEEIEEFYSEKDIVKISDEKERKEEIRKQAVRLVDILPRDMDDLRLIFAKERNAPSKDEMEELLEILEKYDSEKDE